MPPNNGDAGRAQAPVVVAGGGIAGLAAAVELSRLGHRVLVLEARRRWGGRAASFRERTTGDELDNGQHALMGCYHHTLAFLDRIGASAKLAWQGRLQVPYFDLITGRTATLRAGPGPSPIHVAAGIARFALLSPAQRIEALLGGLRILALRRRQDPLLLHVTVEDLLRFCRQSPSTRERLWNPIAIATLNELPSRAAAAPFAEVIARAFFGSRRDSQFVFPRVSLSELYVPGALDFVRRHGGAAQLGAPVEGLVRNGEEIRAVVVRGGEVIPASAVVCALPPGAARNLLAEHGVAIPAFDYAPIVSVYLWFQQPPELPPFFGLLGGHGQWVFHRASLWGQTACAAAPDSHIVSVVISAARSEAQRHDGELIHDVTAELRCAFPHLARMEIRHALVVREKRATPSLTPELDRQRPPTRTRLRNLFLAGDWIATGLPATIESAVASGFAAARAVVPPYSKS
ncbi:MAG: phytoene dehydrogenase [Candidatus Binatia bacterium]|nr:MAG: phytoene dehydrogenase [Candidatus Binatia bacterium]